MSEKALSKHIVDIEYETGKTNTDRKNRDYEAAVDMLECERTEKNADWMSDIFIPEFAAQMLTQSSEEANQYFQTKDFVEVYLQDGSDEAVAKAEASKELTNRTLNQSHLHHYQKFMRANINKNIGGEVYAICRWERKTNLRLMPAPEAYDTGDMDEMGNPIIGRRETMKPMPFIEADRFNYDIVDRRNIFMDNSYCYSLQDKKWVIVREEKTLDQLKDEADIEGYDLDGFEEDMKPQTETDTSKETYNADDQEMKVEMKGNMEFDVLHRYGKCWSMVKELDENGYPTPLGVEIGIDDEGNPKEGAQLVECLVSIAVSGSSKKLIRYLAQPFKDALGIPYRPLIKGLCYIHPTKDEGLGDGRYSRELQIAINDTFNISNDRVSLATLPTMKGKKYSLEDNPTVYFEPNHLIEVEDPNDVVEMVISDNIEGALKQIGQLKQAMSMVTGKFPPQMGAVPELASTTATATAGAEQHSGKRDTYKALTFEYTFMNPFYWMISQMTYQFALPETAQKLMGNKLENFDPLAEHTYKPLSQSVQSEYSKANQIREMNQMMSVLAPVIQFNPKGPVLFNYMIAQMFTLFGDEHEKFTRFLLDENAPVGAQTGTNQPVPTQNQNGGQQGFAEQAVRGNA